MALGFDVMNSRTAYGYRTQLNTMSKRCKEHIIWGPGHSDIPSNCRADELARYGTTIELSYEFLSIGSL